MEEKSIDDIRKELDMNINVEKLPAEDDRTWYLVKIQLFGNKIDEIKRVTSQLHETFEPNKIVIEKDKYNDDFLITKNVPSKDHLSHFPAFL